MSCNFLGKEFEGDKMKHFKTLLLNHTSYKCLFLLERNDTKAKQLFIEYYNSIINNLTVQINNNKDIIKSINELNIEEKTP